LGCHPCGGANPSSHDNAGRWEQLNHFSLFTIPSKDQIYYVHQRPYSIRKVSKNFGGAGRLVRDFSKEERSIFSIKGCSLENQPMMDLSHKYPGHIDISSHFLYHPY
jgi:hypothetical protein